MMFLLSDQRLVTQSQPGEHSMSIMANAKKIYESKLKASLEEKHRGEHVAIEPVSETYLLGRTFIEAALAAKQAHPDRKSFVIRIGHDAAFHIGAGTL